MNRLRNMTSVLATRFRYFRQRGYLKMLYNLQRQRYYDNAMCRVVVSDLKVSVVVPCYNTMPAYFEHLLSSVFRQSYTNWELVMVDGSTDLACAEYLAMKAAADVRIKYIRIKNKGIADTTNVGITAATGDLIAFLDHDDVLDPNALAYSVEQFENFPDTGLVYSDEDKLSDDGSMYLDPHYKPDFSLDLLRNVNYITHFVVVRTNIVREVGGIRSGYEGAQDYDFLLRVVDTGAVIRHVPEILYHWRLARGSTAADFSNKSHITAAGVRALNGHYKRRGINNVTTTAILNRPGFYITKYALDSRKRAVVILLPVGTSRSVRAFITSTYSSNLSIKKAKVKVLSIENAKDVNLSSFNDVMFVRDTVIPANTSVLLTQLFGVSEETGIFAVSPRIVSSGHVEDMGMVYDEARGRMIPLFKGLDPNVINLFGSYEWVHNVNALSGRVFVISGENLRNYTQHGIPPFKEIAPIDQDDRAVIWAHVDLVALSDCSVTSPVSASQYSFFNRNLEINYSTRPNIKTDVQEAMTTYQGLDNVK